MDESDYFLLEFGLVLLFLFFLTFLAFFESALHRLTRFDLKLLNKQHHHKKYEVLHLLSHNNLKVIIPLNFGIQLSFIILTILTTHIVLIQIKFFPVLWAFLILFIVNILFCQLVPRIVTYVHPDKKFLFFLPLFSLFLSSIAVFRLPN